MGPEVGLSSELPSPHLSSHKLHYKIQMEGTFPGGPALPSPLLMRAKIAVVPFLCPFHAALTQGRENAKRKKRSP